MSSDELHQQFIDELRKIRSPWPTDIAPMLELLDRMIKAVDTPLNPDHPLPVSVYQAQIERLTADLKQARRFYRAHFLLHSKLADILGRVKAGTATNEEIEEGIMMLPGDFNHETPLTPFGEQVSELLKILNGAAIEFPGLTAARRYTTIVKSIQSGLLQ
jgi:hypothetical protein